ncbi:MAG TPA: hypothetical protein VGI73_15315 [Solirubrobacterales bacterium]
MTLNSQPRWQRGLIAFAAVLVLAALVVPTVAGAAGPGNTATSSAERPVLFSKQCANRSYKPTEFIIACADASITFKVQEYATWDRSDALASGVLSFPDCAPNVPLVACKKTGHDRATVRLFRPRLCPKEGRRYYTRLLMFDSEAATKSMRRIKLRFNCSDVR